MWNFSSPAGAQPNVAFANTAVPMVFGTHPAPATAATTEADMED
jgi:hypothetical protein